MNAGRTLHPESLSLLVDEILLPHTDFERMSRLAMGKYWKQSSDSQRQQFVQEFKELLIRTYATAIHRVLPEDISYLPERNSGAPDKTVVRTEVRPEGMAVMPVTTICTGKTGIGWYTTCVSKVSAWSPTIAAPSVQK